MIISELRSLICGHSVWCEPVNRSCKLVASAGQCALKVCDVRTSIVVALFSLNSLTYG